MAVKIIVDSASDILPEQAKELGIIHLPLKVRFGDEEYEDAVNLSHKEFYEKLVNSEELPTTSQISPAEFIDVYEKVTSAGDTVVVVTISSKLSGTYQSAVLAAQDYEGKIFVVDSENACVGERLLALRGHQLAGQGLSAADIAEKLDEEKKNIRLYAVLDTLEYLKKGGRISAAVAFAGGLLNLKPIIQVKDGEVVMAGKARGSRQANNLLTEMVKNHGGIDFDRPFCYAYSGLTDESVQKYIEECAELRVGYDGEVPVACVGCTIGTHVGPGAVAITFFEK